MRAFFHGGISLPKISKGILYANKKVEQILKGKILTKNSKAALYQIGVKESNGDFTSGLTRPLAVEIVFPPFWAIEERE
jgi:hypothetical protein